MSEQEFLRDYDARQFPRPSVTVDLVIATVLDADLKVLLVRRGAHPFLGAWALPGGFVRVSEDPADQGEDLDEAAARELEEETGLRGVFLEQLRAFGRPGRDPRGRVITVAYYALVRPDLAPLVHAGTDASEARWWSVRHELPALAFDHAEILTAVVQRLRERLDLGPLAFELVPPAFTVAELRAVYEAVRGEPQDPGNFRRGFQRLVSDGVIAPAPGKRPSGTKPAAVWRFVRPAS